MCFGVMAFTCITQHFTRGCINEVTHKVLWCYSELWQTDSSVKAAWRRIYYFSNAISLKRFHIFKLIQYNYMSVSSDMVPPDSKRCRLLSNFRFYLQSFNFSATNLLMNLLDSWISLYTLNLHSFRFQVFYHLLGKICFLSHGLYFVWADSIGLCQLQ